MLWDIVTQYDAMVVLFGRHRHERFLVLYCILGFKSLVQNFFYSIDIFAINENSGMNLLSTVEMYSFVVVAYNAFYLSYPLIFAIGNDVI